MSDRRSTAAEDVAVVPETPEDVAILYSWANLPAAKYRDFSASRREYRAQQRARLAEEQHKAELESARVLEEAAKRDLEEAQRALELAGRAEAEAVADAAAKLRAEELFRQAQAHAHREHEEAQRRQQSAETLRLRAQSARNEMMAARKRAEEQAARYADYDAQYRAQMESRMEELPPGQLEDPYYYTGQVDPAYFASTPGVRTSQASRASTERKAYVFPVHPGSDEYDAGTLQAYRPSTTFAPSPAQDYRNLSPMRDLPSLPELSSTREREERNRPDEQARLTGQDRYDVQDAEADDNYYSDGDRSAQSKQQTGPFQGYNTAEHDLHIRPQPRFVREELTSITATPSGSDRSSTRITQPILASRRTAAVDNRARTVRQPRSEGVPQPEMFPSSMDVSPAVPAAWLNSQEEAAASVKDTRPLASPEPARYVDRQMLLQSSATRPLSFVPATARFSEQPASFQREPATQAAVPAMQAASSPSGAMPAPDTLQQSRERVASRWFALQGLMEQQAEGEKSQPHPASMPVPLVALLSLSGGVGKTSMTATLGRALSSLSEKVLMADTNIYGLLPYYFGARDLRSGAVRTFTPPAGSSDAPVYMVHYELDRIAQDEAAQSRLLQDLTERAAGVQRVLVDLNGSSLWLARRLAYVSSYVLVPVAPDMNSILTTQTIENIFVDIRGVGGEPVRPYYVLNQYDPALPLHLDVREVLQQSLGDRLLPMTIHRSPTVSEALAEGMTVIDYAPGTPVADDYMRLASWIRSLAVPGITGMHGARWSER